MHVSQHPMFLLHIVSQINHSVHHSFAYFFFLFVSALALFYIFYSMYMFFPIVSIFSSFLILYIDEKNHINKKG